MVLKTCPDCGHDISSKARSCPSCGRPAKRASAWPYPVLGVLAVVTAAAVGVGISQETEADEMSATDAEIADAIRQAERDLAQEDGQPQSVEQPAQEAIPEGCRTEDECWAGAFHQEATTACTEAIESMMSSSEIRWTEGMLEWRFDRYHWADAEEGVITYLSNAMEIELVPDQWVASVVECDFDGDTQEVVAVRQN